MNSRERGPISYHQSLEQTLLVVCVLVSPNASGCVSCHCFFGKVGCFCQRLMIRNLGFHYLLSVLQCNIEHNSRANDRKSRLVAHFLT